VSNKIGYFGLRARLEDVPGTLSRVALACAPVDAVPEQVRVKQYGAWTSIVIAGWEFGHVHEWAQSASEIARTAAVSVFVFEGTWSYGVFDRGKHLAGMEWYPEEHPCLRGNLEQASRLLGVSEKLLKRYCIGDVRLDPDEEDINKERLAVLEELADRLESEYRACAGDEYPPWDEWGHVDFVRKIGFDYPDPDDGHVFRRTTTPKRKRWPARKMLTERDTVYQFTVEAFLRDCGIDRP
jgi:hypothetical protein